MLHIQEFNGRGSSFGRLFALASLDLCLRDSDSPLFCQPSEKGRGAAFAGGEPHVFWNARNDELEDDKADTNRPKIQRPPQRLDPHFVILVPCVLRQPMGAYHVETNMGRMRERLREGQSFRSLLFASFPHNTGLICLGPSYRRGSVLRSPRCGLLDTLEARHLCVYCCGLRIAC
jgi:hypothetical protein